MKKLLIALAIASVFAACKSDTKSDLETNKIIMSDTTSAYPANASSDTGTAIQRGARPLPAASHTSTSEKRSESPKSTSSSTTKTETTTTTTKKKGWSSRAKGAVIGGAAGAIGGAVISKHKGTGAVVGGVAGAAGGYIIGNEIDKKNNR